MIKLQPVFRIIRLASNYWLAFFYGRFTMRKPGERGGFRGNDPVTKTVLPRPPMTMFELVEAIDLASQAKLWVWNHRGIAGKSFIWRLLWNQL
ncbi:hypothetical protein PSTEL_21025 [Paenibacillus stellifer]|uniref:Uncharacterized protein n=1 Tax=Paenibacillus stellifer TaxID=169760 RepID=A0A089LYL7_9BACL|nr:hypothetical protein PSTEL_21025 [Paenibacillus stellifer]